MTTNSSGGCPDDDAVQSSVDNENDAAADAHPSERAEAHVPDADGFSATPPPPGPGETASESSQVSDSSTAHDADADPSTATTATAPAPEMSPAGTSTLATTSHVVASQVEPSGGGPIKRIKNWFERPWTRERSIKFFFGTLPALVIPTVVMLFATQFFGSGPDGDGGSVFANNTPTGGDFGAHVWGPDYLWDHVLSSGWYNGWSMDWYAGLPAYRFYMVVPALMILFFNIFLPYGIAMKLVSVLGVVTIPAMCWAFGRLANFRYPMPEIFAFAGLAFVLDESWSIYGGNLKSTMAGEFSFSIALSLAILGLGLFAYGLETGRKKVTAAVVLSLAAVSHGLVLIFLAIALVVTSVVWVLSARGATDGNTKQRMRFVGFVGVGMVLLSAWWVVPFVANHDYMTDMKYTPEPSGASFDSFWDMYFPLTAFLDILVTSLALIGFYVAGMRRQLNAIAVGFTYLVLALLVAITSRWGLPMLGLLWNPRLLPFFYLCRNILMGYGAYELMAMVYNHARRRFSQERIRTAPSTVFAGVFSIIVLVVLGFMYQVSIPGVTGTTPDTNPDGEAINRYYVGPIQATDTNKKAQGSSWARYNFRGYEGGAQWDEYRNVVNTMDELGKKYGCGRAQWENHKDNGGYGTTMALMLLPYWTNSCIGSMEGLFFEASGTTPYHFLSTSAMSESSSDPVRALRYEKNDASVGVPELQALGVKYTMLRSDAARAQAAQQPDLVQVAESGPWTIYVVKDSPVIAPLAVQPVVVNERGGDRRERLLEIGTSWFQNQEEWAAMPATDGPDNWQRIDVEVDTQFEEFNDEGRKVRVDVVKPVQEIKVVEQPQVEVSNIDIRNQSLSFDVSEVGTPIEVKVSYFPNWKAKGADGPYRIGPNMMVVVPTDTHVELTFGRTWLDYFSVLLTIAGIVWCVIGWRRGDIAMRPLRFGAYAERLELAAAATSDAGSGAPSDGNLRSAGEVPAWAQSRQATFGRPDHQPGSDRHDHDPHHEADDIDDHSGDHDGDGTVQHAGTDAARHDEHVHDGDADAGEDRGEGDSEQHSHAHDGDSEERDSGSETHPAGGGGADSGEASTGASAGISTDHPAAHAPPRIPNESDSVPADHS